MKPPPKWCQDLKSSYLGGFVAILGAALYPIAIHPIPALRRVQDNNNGKEKRRKRNNTNQGHTVQPGDMKVWSDTFRQEMKRCKTVV
uniref:Putative membrane protein n=1 Tax=Ixodes ricinus TaxID=34613 RepID=A0A090XC62_IXORI